MQVKSPIMVTLPKIILMKYQVNLKYFIPVLKKKISRGASVTQSVKHLALDFGSVHDLNGS